MYLIFHLVVCPHHTLRSDPNPIQSATGTKTTSQQLGIECLVQVLADAEKTVLLSFFLPSFSFIPSHLSFTLILSISVSNQNQ